VEAALQHYWNVRQYYTDVWMYVLLLMFACASLLSLVRRPADADIKVRSAACSPWLRVPARCAFDSWTA
jgi:hypothetical protein